MTGGALGERNVRSRAVKHARRSAAMGAKSQNWAILNDHSCDHLPGRPMPDLGRMQPIIQPVKTYAQRY